MVQTFKNAFKKIPSFWDSLLKFGVLSLFLLLSWGAILFSMLNIVVYDLHWASAGDYVTYYGNIANAYVVGFYLTSLVALGMIAAWVIYCFMTRNAALKIIAAIAFVVIFLIGFWLLRSPYSPKLDEILSITPEGRKTMFEIFIFVGMALNLIPSFLVFLFVPPFKGSKTLKAFNEMGKKTKV